MTACSNKRLPCCDLKLLATWSHSWNWPIFATSQRLVAVSTRMCDLYIQMNDSVASYSFAGDLNAHVNDALHKIVSTQHMFGFQQRRVAHSRNATSLSLRGYAYIKMTKSLKVLSRLHFSKAPWPIVLYLFIVGICSTAQTLCFDLQCHSALYL